MKQAGHTVIHRRALERLHDDVIVVQCHVHIRIDRCQLMLSRGDLVVLSLGEDTQFPQTLIDIPHESGDFLFKRPEVMIIELLPLRRHRTEKCAPRIDQIVTAVVFLSVNQEILLLDADLRNDMVGMLASQQSH